MSADLKLKCLELALKLGDQYEATPDALALAKSYYEWVSAGKVDWQPTGSGGVRAVVTYPLQGYAQSAVFPSANQRAAQPESVTTLFAAHAAEKAKPSDPETAPTVAPFEGCWATLRNGETVGPINRRPGAFMYPWGENGGDDVGTTWTSRGRHWDLVAIHERDIIAVHASDPRITPESPADDGWIEWKGGECPVGRDVEVEAEFRNGARRQGPAVGWVWLHAGDRVDIVRYRLSRPSK